MACLHTVYGASIFYLQTGTLCAMTIETWLAFVVTSAILVAIPGPTILAVMSYSIAHGSRARWPLVLAVALGDATALAGSILGLGLLLATSALWFTVVKVVGGVYLLYLGAKMLLRSQAGAVVTDVAPMESARELFTNTFVVTALNPKGLVFFIAFLPQFVSPQADTNSQLWLLAATFVALGTLNAALYAVFAESLRHLLASDGAQRWFNRVGGGLLSVAGIWAIMARRPV